MRAAPPAVRTMAKLSGADEVARKDGIAARLGGKVAQHRGTEDSDVSKRATVGPADRRCLGHLLLGLDRKWLLLADLLQEHLLGGVALAVFPLAFPELHPFGRAVDYS